MPLYPSRDEAIHALARQFWIERGRPEGSPEVDWQRAVEAADRNPSLWTPEPEQRQAGHPLVGIGRAIGALLAVLRTVLRSVGGGKG